MTYAGAAAVLAALAALAWAVASSPLVAVPAPAAQWPMSLPGFAPDPAGMAATITLPNDKETSASIPTAHGLGVSLPAGRPSPKPA